MRKHVLALALVASLLGLASCSGDENASSTVARGDDRVKIVYDDVQQPKQKSGRHLDSCNLPPRHGRALKHRLPFLIRLLNSYFVERHSLVTIDSF
jgi:hypothetical protein